jgi:hypothetical protein
MAALRPLRVMTQRAGDPGIGELDLERTGLATPAMQAFFNGLNHPYSDT